jgi:hypothetical protein
MSPSGKSPPATKNSITIDVDAVDNEQQIGQMAPATPAISNRSPFLANSSAEAILMNIPNENQLQNIPPLGSLNDQMPGMVVDSMASTPPLLGGTEVEATTTNMMETGDNEEREYSEWPKTRRLSELKVHELKVEFMDQLDSVYNNSSRTEPNLMILVLN